ncbi:hypothetical protein [Pseudomonas sp. Au-Pse12]|uniref:hypothetical protein n=1 Tax=Pseudomonas sp. Au-Pse12 TaxID=2906459 RepID=UPI001E2C185D|nr:hypothetical protein [Pseudomonas sp. Au-Pse12]MCE4057966.1 hypothetical protein [Pseudomonas sp. Au-Pse12]
MGVTPSPGDVVALVAAMPPPPPLNASTATTPELQKILVAHQALEAAQAAQDKKDASLAGLLASAANDQGQPAGWQDLLADQVGNLQSSGKQA